MFCLKCGAEISEKAVFCQHCLAEMEKYPVKPDAKFFIPQNRAPSVNKKVAPRKKVISPEDKISRMKKTIQLLSIVLAVSLMALVLSIALLVESITTETPEASIGQNYGTIEHKD